MKILLIDDHTLFREGVCLLLRPLASDLAVVEAGSCEEGLEVLEREGTVDLVLMDISLPGMNGLQGIPVVRELHPGTAVVALSSADDKATVLQALDAGAVGFIPKSSSSSVLVGALKLIMAKGIYLPPSVFLPTARSGEDALPQGQADASIAMAATGPRPFELGLTERQTQVLQLILKGLPAKLICRELDLSPGTVKAHTSAVLRALNVTTRTQAVVAAGRLGLRF